MRQIYPDLWQTATDHPIPDAPRVATHAYLLTRPEGNLLFYATRQPEEHDAIAELGGLTRQYLSHEDEVGPHLAVLRERFGGQLVCHAAELEAVQAAAPVDLTFEGRETHLGNLEVIPTPGHTPGSACFLLRSPHGKSYLFTGDTLFLSDGRWETLVFREEDRAVLRRSLAILAELEPDVVLSSASLGEPAYREMRPGEWRRAVEGAARRLAEEAAA